MGLIVLLAITYDPDRPDHICRFSWCDSTWAYDPHTGKIAAICCTHPGCNKYVTPEEMECE